MNSNIKISVIIGTTGIVLDCGDSVTFSTPIYEGYSLPHSVLRSKIGGRDLTNYLQILLSQSSCKETKDFFEKQNGFLKLCSTERKVVIDIKEKLLYIPLDYENEIEKFEDPNVHRDFLNELRYSYKLPDGSIFDNYMLIETERFKCPELLFQPNLMGHKCDGIDKMLYNSIMKCEIEVRKDLYNNVVCAGGTSMIAGLRERLSKELRQLMPTQVSSSIKVIPQSEITKYNVWIGGSILSSLSTFEEMWITKDEYDENGSSIVHRKCCM